MTNPSPRSKYRTKARAEMATAYSPNLSDVQTDAIVDHVWTVAADSEARFDELLRALVAAQRTWWGTPTLRSR